MLVLLTPMCLLTLGQQTKGSRRRHLPAAGSHNCRPPRGWMIRQGLPMACDRRFIHQCPGDGSTCELASLAPNRSSGVCCGLASGIRLNTRPNRVTTVTPLTTVVPRVTLDRTGLRRSSSVHRVSIKAEGSPFAISRQSPRPLFPPFTFHPAATPQRRRISIHPSDSSSTGGGFAVSVTTESPGITPRDRLEFWQRFSKLVDRLLVRGSTTTPSSITNGIERIPITQRPFLVRTTPKSDDYGGYGNKRPEQTVRNSATFRPEVLRRRPINPENWQPSLQQYYERTDTERSYYGNRPSPTRQTEQLERPEGPGTNTESVGNWEGGFTERGEVSYGTTTSQILTTTGSLDLYTRHEHGVHEPPFTRNPEETGRPIEAVTELLGTIETGNIGSERKEPSSPQIDNVLLSRKPEGNGTKKLPRMPPKRTELESERFQQQPNHPYYVQSVRQYPIVGGRPRILMIEEGSATQQARREFRLVASMTLIIDGQSNILVDTGLDTDAAARHRLISTLHELKLNANDINYVILTHDHPDHSGHSNMFPAALHYSGDFAYYGNTFTLTNLFESDVYTLNENVAIYRTPGHTTKDISVVVTNTTHLGTVSIVGDLFMSELDIEATDMWRPLAVNATLQERNRKRILCLSNHIVPGHGKLFAVTQALRQKFNCKPHSTKQ